MELVIVFLVITLVVSVILILVAGRRDEEGSLHRSEVRYLGALGYLTLFVAVLAVFLAVGGLADLIVDHDRQGPGGGGPLSFQERTSNDDNYRLVTGSGLVAAVAAGIFVFHFRRRQELEAQRIYERGVPASVSRAYFFAVAFTAVFLVLVSAPIAIYGVFRLIGPGLYGEGPHGVTRQVGLAQLLSFGYLTAAASAVFWATWAHAGARTSRPGRPDEAGDSRA